MTTVKESCSCGAKFEYDDTTAYTIGARAAAKEWRESHRHEAVTPPPPVQQPEGAGESLSTTGSHHSVGSTDRYMGFRQ